MTIDAGLNRRLNNQSSTIAASKKAVEEIKSLYAIELGNEPDREEPCAIKPLSID